MNAASDEQDSESRFEAMTYEQLVGALEVLTDRMASGELGIEEAADLYEQARALYDAAGGRLAAVQARIDRLAPAAPTVPQGQEPVV